MAVQQLGPESSRAGARRARALAARAGGPTVALVALSTVTVTSLVAIAFAPLPHAVSPGVGGGVAAPSNVRALTPAKVVHSPEAPTPKKTPKATGSAFTSTPPAAGGSTTTSNGATSGGTTTHHSGGSSAVGNGGHGTGTGDGTGSGGNGGSGPTRPGAGNGNGNGGGHNGGGNGTAGDPSDPTTPTPVCDTDPPEHPDTDVVVDTNKSPICVIPTPPHWHNGGGTGHIIVIPRPTAPVVPPTDPTDGGGTDGGNGSGEGTGTTGGHGGGTTPESSPAPTKPNGPSGTTPGSVTLPHGTHVTPAVVTPAAQVEVPPTVKVATSLVKAHSTATTTTATDNQVNKVDKVDKVARAAEKADNKDAKHGTKSCAKHRTYAEHRAGGKHRA